MSLTPVHRAASVGRLVVLLIVGVTVCTADTIPPKVSFELSVIHLNDFHARFEEVLPTGGACPSDDTSACVGGIARVVAAYKQLRDEKPDALVLNAGDNFQGTLWFSVFGWNVTAQFLNMIPWDAITLGNHEFDRKVDDAVAFIKALDAPVVVANIDDSEEPTFQGIYRKTLIKEINGTKVGIIGVITNTTQDISSPGKLKFLDVAKVVAEEGKKLNDSGVNIVVVLSHAGIEIDQEVAKEDKYVDIIVGGHSHTLLHNGNDSDSGEEVFSAYPLIVIQDDLRKVAIVQAGSYSRHIGSVTAYFDNFGSLMWAEGDTMYLDKNVPQDNETLAAMEPLADSLRERAREVMGNTAVLLEQNGGVCGGGECNLGNMVADAMVQWEVNKGPNGTWTRAAIAFTNSGGLRAPIAPGNISYNDLVTTLPFENTIDYMEINGSTIIAALQKAVSQPRRRGPRSGPWRASYFGFLQVSGLHIRYDLGPKAGDAAVSVEVLCHDCEVPKYEPLDPEKWYPVSINSFLAGGGDGYYMFRDEGVNHSHGDLDMDVLRSFLEARNPLTPSRDGRIVIKVNETDGSGHGSGTGLVAVNLLLALSAALVKAM